MRLLLSSVMALTFVPAATAGLPNPCTLLTNTEVAKVFGAKVQSRAGESNRYGRSCTWDGVAPGSFSSYHATLRIDIAPATKAAFLKAAKRQKNVIPVRGLGELAYSQYVAGEFLNVWQRGISLSVELGGSTTPVVSAKALARFALARL